MKKIVNHWQNLIKRYLPLNPKFKHVYLSIILVITIIAFSNSLKNDFTNWDDDFQVVNNNDIKNLTTVNIVKIFTEYYLGMYQPLTSLSFAIEFKFFGLNPLPYHTDNLLLHLLNVILVFYFIYFLRARSEERRENLNISLIVALIFGIHPMHVESVAWVSERKDLLYSFFFLCGLITYTKSVKCSELGNQFTKYRYIAITFIFFILSLLSKSSAVCFPLVLILIDYYLINNFRLKLNNLKPMKIMQYLADKLPFLILAIIFGVISINSQKNYGAIIDISHSFSIFDRIFLVSYSASFYIIRLIMPVKLCIMHDYPTKLSGMLPIEYYLSSIFIISIFVTIIIIKSSQFKKDLIFGLLFYLITIIFVLQIIPVGYAITAEHYSYLPYIGLVFTIGIFLLKIINENKLKILIFKFLLVIITLIFLMLTYNRNKVWENGVTLFTDVIKKNPNYGDGYNSRGVAYFNMQRYNEAIKDYNKAISLKPDFVEAYNNRGNAYYVLNKYNEAINDWEKAIQLNPGYGPRLSKLIDNVKTHERK